MEIINYLLLTFMILIGILWVFFLYCVFIMEYLKGSKQYYWIKRHILTDEDLEPKE